MQVESIASAWNERHAVEQANIAPAIRAWLTFSGLLSTRMRELFGSKYALRVLREEHTANCAEALHRMACPEGPALLREIEIANGTERAMFAQTCIPASTLRAQPWLASLGTNSLGETLASVNAVRRSDLEFKELRPGDALFAAALSRGSTARSLWARRSIFAIDGAPLLVTEVFLPELERWPPC
jgi:chorismate--pyruvate lyase